MGIAVSARADVNRHCGKRGGCEPMTKNSVPSDEIRGAAGKARRLGGEARWDVTCVALSPVQVQFHERLSL